MNSPTYHIPRIIPIIGTLIVILLLVNVGATVYLGRNASRQRYAPPVGQVQNLIESVTLQFGSNNEANKVPQTLLDERQTTDFMKAGFYLVSSYASTSAHLEKTDLLVDPDKPLTIALSSGNGTGISVCEQGRLRCQAMSKHKLSRKPVAVGLQLLPNQLKITVEETYGSLKEGVHESDPVTVRFD
ncbi:MAG: hypothetical protein WCJ70_02790 [bacterium]